MLSSNYKHHLVEQKWQKVWADSEIYKWQPEETRGNSFVIDTPPPTISGLLHMGHVFSYTQADFIARFQRMLGKNVFYPMGYDDNGLPTERLVEKMNGVRAAELPQQEFIDMCYSIIKGTEAEFKDLFQAIALSCDWTQEYQTISNHTAKISQMSFLDLYYKGVVTRRYAPTFWDIADKTAIAQAEIEDKEEETLFSQIKFHTENSEELLIATTRPELLPACVAVFYHPKDVRYTHLGAQKAVTPIFADKVPILPDHEVDPVKGTGLVMCCTFGDTQDVKWWKRHNLEAKNCIARTGYMQNAGILSNLSIKAARTTILELLQEQQLIGEQTKIIHTVKCAERSGGPLEILTTNQWYISLLPHKATLLEKANECQWFPAYMKTRLENWIHGLNQDWCISRQRCFGIPFPVWYSRRAGEEGKVLTASLAQLPVDPKVDLPVGYTADEVTPETDIMDTWATSSLTPQISSHAVTKDFSIDYERHQKLYPADLRVQAHEIIRTWAFDTIVKSLHHENSVPWKNLMISGWCLAHDGTKMSKSKGNVVTPKSLILEKSADAVRYWASHSKLGTDIAYSEDTFKIGNKLITKLWNASKFILLHFSHLDEHITSAVEAVDRGLIFCDLDLWILSRLYQVVKYVTAAFTRFEYADARHEIEKFFWQDFCDNYLELIKARIYDDNKQNPKEQKSAVYTIYYCMYNLLRLFAPLLPHITEELNSALFVNAESVHVRGAWPKLESQIFVADKLKQGYDAIKILELVRQTKSLNNLALSHPINTLRLSGATFFGSLLSDLKSASQAVEIEACTDLIQEGVVISECGKYKVLATFSHK